MANRYPPSFRGYGSYLSANVLLAYSTDPADRMDLLLRIIIINYLEPYIFVQIIYIL